MGEEKNNGKIDKDVLEVMKEEDILKAFSDEKQIKRVILNCFCEFLSEIKGLRSQVEDLVHTMTICSTDKLQSFFKELKTNVEDEEKRIDLQEKIKKSHQKSKKNVKTSKKIAKFKENSVK